MARELVRLDFPDLSLTSWGSLLEIQGQFPHLSLVLALSKIRTAGWKLWRDEQSSRGERRSWCLLRAEAEVLYVNMHFSYVCVFVQIRFSSLRHLAQGLDLH